MLTRRGHYVNETWALCYEQCKTNVYVELKVKRFTISEYSISIKAQIQQERNWQPLECTAFVIRQNMSIHWQAMRQHCIIKHFYFMVSWVLTSCRIIVLFPHFGEKWCPQNHRTYLLIYFLTPWSRILKKLTGLHLVKKFPAQNHRT